MALAENSGKCVHPVREQASSVGHVTCSVLCRTPILWTREVRLPEGKGLGGDVPRLHVAGCSAGSLWACPSDQVGEWARLSGGLGGQACELVSRALRAKQTRLLCEGLGDLCSLPWKQHRASGEGRPELSSPLQM